jgi:menaquinol-cytochrome c reductase iron-sulfur subunit
MSADAKPESRSRRAILTAIVVGAVTTAAGALMAAPAVRFVVYPLMHPTSGADWFPLGKLDSFQELAPIRAEVDVRKRDGWRVTTTRQTVWVTRSADGQLLVLSAICTHLGCVVPYKPELQQFACPCHRAFYAKDGARISGPQRRGLDPLPTKIENDTLYVRYQYFRQLVAYREVLG